jgi:RNA polymerase sigma factor (sigma-70 family)
VRSRWVAAGTGAGPRGSDPAGALLVRARTDPNAFGELYDRCAPTILGWFLRRTGSPHLAMELAAETFAQALAGLHRFDPAAGTGTAWLFGIAGHQYHRLLRRGAVDRRHRRRLAMVTPVITPDDVERVVELVDAQELAPELHAALDALSDGVRDAVWLRVGHDLPYADVAARLGCTEGSARVRVKRGLRQLALALVVR